MGLFGRKENFCILSGVQGVVKTITSENTSGSTVIFSIDNPGNNYLYVFKGYSGGAFGTVPEAPDADFNFKVTINNSNGFTGTIAAFVRLYSTTTTEVPAEEITVKYNNPDFDVTEYTTIHLHYWYDGLNYCCKVDGYV